MKLKFKAILTILLIIAWFKLPLIWVILNILLLLLFWELVIALKKY
jgi:hypothetical protein